VQLAVVSQIRIDEILNPGNRTHSPDVANGHDDDAGDGLAIHDLHLTFDSGFRLAGADLHLEPGGIVGVVTPTGSEPDDLFSLLAGDGNPDSGHVLLDGRDVRMPGVRGSIACIPADAIAFDVPTLEQLQAVDPLLTPADALTVVDNVGLAHLGSSGRPAHPAGHRALRTR
jgi:ABC-type multidrug transport system fused ATPase/permease subunit